MVDGVGSDAYDYCARVLSPRSKVLGAQSIQAFSDRFIPSRKATNFLWGFQNLEVNENAKPANKGSPGSSSATSVRDGVAEDQENGAVNLYHQLLQSELLEKSPIKEDNSRMLAPAANNNLFRYQSGLEEAPDWFSQAENSISPVPLRISEHCMHTKKTHRKIRKTPLRVMDAPDMLDDFYLNLLDWSPSNELAVGLGTNVYVWNASSNRVSRMCDLGCDNVTSLGWAARSNMHLAVGTSNGELQIWDKENCKQIQTMGGHCKGVCSLAWNGFVLSTGGRDGYLCHRDVRERADYFSKFRAHKSQVCGLKWSPDEQKLATGSDDCKVRVWNLHSNLPILEHSKHKAAVKALAWSPHQAGVLASGGGVADRCIHLWNTTNDVTMKSVETGSQVCNLMWSKNVNEIVSTHGYSLFEVAVWKASSMTRIATLNGHRQRVLYLTVSPDGRRIATGSGDNTVCTWDIFPAARAAAKDPKTVLLSTIR